MSTTTAQPAIGFIGPGWEHLFLRTYGVDPDASRTRFYRLPACLPEALAWMTWYGEE